MKSSVKDQYESWPYPSLPRIASIPRESLWQIHLNWIRTRCGIPPLKTQANIWIAGCGTFEPYVFSQANPGAKILATDLSNRSLEIARKRLKWHRKNNTSVQQLDLNNTQLFPEETFDFIECYGVLMCLPDPLKTLKALASRLKPDGILRIMVYPHYSRQRIFQIQRLAKLLGLSFRKPDHPELLRSVMKNLPRANPLSYAFFSYWDSKNLPGIVDGFLHASDRGFTGIELSHMISQAGLSPKFCFHRPWGQPDLMAEKLKPLGNYPFAFWLHYLDLWQSLRTNFTLCLTKKELESQWDFPGERHPLFNLRDSDVGLSHKAKLIALSMKGARLPSRTSSEPLKLSSKNIKNLLLGREIPNSLESEILLNPTNTMADSSFDESLSVIKPKKHFVPRDSKRILNPLYDYLFDAYTFKEQTDTIIDPSLPDLKSQINIWKNEAYPLEDSTHPFGLTPFGTYKNNEKEILSFSRDYLTANEIPFSDLVLPTEKRAFADVKNFLKDIGISLLPDDSESVMRQLWILLFSYNKLFLDT